MRKYPSPLQAIRRHCIQCMGGQNHEVRFCTDLECNLYPFRLGRNPNRKGVGGNTSKARQTLHGEAKNARESEFSGNKGGG